MKEIAFAINSKATVEQNCLVLDLVQGEGRPFALSEKSELKTVAQWRILAQNPADKEALTILLKEEFSYQNKLTGKTPHAESFQLNQVHIFPSQVQAALKILAPTQKLFFQGKQLVVDLYGKVEFFYEAKRLEGGKLEVMGKLRWKEIEIEIPPCIIPGKPLAFVYGISLKMMEPAPTWNRLKELKNGPLILEGMAKQAFLDAIDDPDEPKLILKEGAIQETAPHPILQLKDRWGACADLWMDYGNGMKIAYHDQEKKNFKRQEKNEIGLEKDLLETDYIKKNVGTSHYYCPLNLVPKSLTFLLEIGWHVEDWQGKNVVKQTGMALQFEEGKSTIAVKGHLKYEAHQADVSQVLGAFNRRETFIQLNPHSVGLLPSNENRQALNDLAEESELIGSERVIQKNRLALLEPLFPFAAASLDLQHLRDKLQNFKGIENAQPSPEFQGTLRPYQQEGVDWLSFLFDYGFHGILADEMGLGKTVQILAFLSRTNPGGTHLIVMPTSLLFNWRNEIKQFLPSRTCKIHQGIDRAKTSDELANTEFILTSYTTLRLDLPLFQTLNFTTIILDEAQTIKNAQTQTAQAVCQLHAQMRICVTGTPVENRLQELWSHFRFLMPDLFGTQEAFEAEIQAGESDKRYLERIRKKISPFLLRRRKEEVLKDLPPRIDQVVWLEMGESQRRHYELLLSGFKTGLLKKVETEGMGKCRLEILEALLRLRQICCHPLLVSSDENPQSAKFDALLQDLETICEEGHKVLIYSQFTSMLKLMTKAAREKNWSFGYLDGSTLNREEVVRKFQEDPSQNLFFISLKAGGVGLNLTSADYVYLYDPWWNDAVEEQAINRAHRIGRKEAVISKRFVIAESIEEKMMKLKQAKKGMFEQLMEGDSVPSNLTIEDLNFLFSI